MSLRVMFVWFAVVLAMGISSSYGHPADKAADNADQEENDADKSDLKPTFMHVVAVGLEEGQPGVGFNTNGVINGKWKVGARFGSIRFDDETSLIEIGEAGYYRFYGQIKHILRTSYPMRHCVGIIKNGKMDDERKQCATSAATYRGNTTWEHSESNFAEGVHYLKKGELVGVRMYAKQIVPTSRAIVFVPEECYFGVERKA